MEQVNVSYQTKKKSHIEQGVEKVKLEVINQGENTSFLQAAANSKKMILESIDGKVLIQFKNDENVIDSYTIEELFALIENKAV